MTVSILTMFNGLTSTYSIVNVVADHIKMMLDNNVNVRMLVSEDCNLDERFGIYTDERIEWIKITNRLDEKQITWYDYSMSTGNVHSSFSDEVNVISKNFVDELRDSDICMMHDILYQGWHLIHNIAIRKAQTSLPNLKFISFSHSLPIERPNKREYPFSQRFEGMDKTIFAYPTQSGIKALAKQYNIPEGNCRVIYNTIPLLEFLSDDVKILNNHFNLLDSDILVIYPGRLSTGKKFEKVSSLCGSIEKSTNKSVKLVFCDFPSADIESNYYKRKIIEDGIKFGMKKENIFFTSNIENYKLGFPRQAVLDLFTLSNLFICPSFSESFGLTVLETGSRGNFLVLNESVPALAELGKTLNAYFMKWDAKNFGFDTIETYTPSEEAYYIDNGNIIVREMFKDKSIFVKSVIKNQYSNDWIWRNQLKPLLYGF